MTKVLVIGLGEIGYNNAKYATAKGLNVDGYDIDDAAIRRALNDKVIQNRAASFAEYDAYLICISTHNANNMYEPDLSGILSLAREIAKEGKPGALVGIDSTISRGTSHKIQTILNHRLHVAHVPHRYFRGDPDHGVNQLRVLGGCDPCCIEKARKFYGDLMGIPLHIVKSIEIAEYCKLVENAYRFVEIAFAEELKMMCDRSDLDFQELRNAVNTKWNIKILEAREGIGGHCLPKDSQMFLDLMRSSLDLSSIVGTAMKVDQSYRSHISKQYVLKQNPS